MKSIACCEAAVWFAWTLQQSVRVKKRVPTKRKKQKASLILLIIPNECAWLNGFREPFRWRNCANIPFVSAWHTARHLVLSAQCLVRASVVLPLAEVRIHELPHIEHLLQSRLEVTAGRISK